MDGTEDGVERCRFWHSLVRQLSHLRFSEPSRAEAAKNDAVCGTHWNIMVRQLSQLRFSVAQ